MKNSSDLPRTVLIIMVTFCLSACDQSGVELDDDLAGDWKVVSYKTSRVITKSEQNTWSQYNNGDVTVSFSEPEQSSGTISGIKVTNSFGGAYSIDGKGGIMISNLYQTFINEPEWGLLLDSITKAESYEIRNNQLIIYYNQRKNNITLVRVNSGN